MESYQRLVDVIQIANLQMRLEHWMLTQVLVWSTLGQAAAVAAAIAFAAIFATPARGKLAAAADRQLGSPTLRGATLAAKSVVRAFVAFLWIVLAYAVASHLG